MEELKSFILKNYIPEHGSFTPSRSEGNGGDQFNDGMSRGYAMALYDMANIINLGVQPLEKQNIYPFN